MWLYKMSPVRRTVLICIAFQVLLWSMFLVSFLNHRSNWENVVPGVPGAAAEGGFLGTLLFILSRNLLICLLIAVGNLFVRFGWFTPGLAVLVVQAVSIGWMAGSNGFEVPFTTVTAANLQYLRIGLWETTAYAVVCAITLPKSLLVATSFPASKWDEVRKLKDIRFDNTEKIIVLAGFAVLFAAAAIEAWFLAA